MPKKIWVTLFQVGAVVCAVTMTGAAWHYCATIATFALKASFGIMPPIGTVSGGARYGAECMAGAMAARSFIKEMVSENAYYRLALRVKEMIEAGKFGGFEVGFFEEIARATGGDKTVLLSDYYAFNDGQDPGVVETMDDFVSGAARMEHVGSGEDS